MAGLQQPLVQTVMEKLGLLHTTKNNTLSPLLHIRKPTTCYLAITPKKFSCFITLRTELLIYMTCTVRDSLLNWQNRCNAGISQILLKTAVSFLSYYITYSSGNFNWKRNKQRIAQHDRCFNRETIEGSATSSLVKSENIKPAYHAGVS